MSLFLLAPNMRVLYSLLFLQRAAEPVREPAFSKSQAGERRWTMAHVSFGVYCLLATFAGALTFWNARGGGAPRSPLFGIWSVDVSLMDGITQPPMLTDSSRFRHIIFQQKGFATVQK